MPSPVVESEIATQMSTANRGGARRLCSLFGESLRPFTGDVAVSMTKDKERSLLITLSQVLREIRSWIDSSSNDGDQDSCGCLNRHSDDNQCRSKILVDLIVLLNVESQFVRHLAGSTLVVVFEFMADYPSDWENIIYLLCYCFVLVFSKIVPHTSATSFGDERFSSDDLIIDILKLGLKDANWNTGAGILGVLCGIIKFLKEEDHAKLIEVFVNSLSSCMFNVPWKSLDMIRSHEHCEDNLDLRSGTLPLMNFVEVEMFLGNLVRMVSSLVDPGGVLDALAELKYKPLILLEILNLLPKILFWCLDEEGSCKSPCILPYFQHKTLMLMMRLSSQIQFDNRILCLWLELLHKYFQDVLAEPINRLDFTDDDSLEGSPFLSSLYRQDKQYSMSRHLRGQALFLFLRCCLSMIGLREASNSDCTCMRVTKCSTSKKDAAEYCCASRKGLLTLVAWLQGQVSFDVIADQKMYVENCIAFASNFIQLYMHQDDLLFEVLLLLFTIPSCSDIRFTKEIHGSQEWRNNEFFHVSNLFNPIILFYVFLAKLQYDPQMLLDYLISKDTGTRCAEYLLRCLRAVCDSWEFFVELSFDREAFSQTCKKKKVSLKLLHSYEEPSSILRKGVHSLSVEQHMNDHISNVSRIRCLLFARAKSCLLSLKDALDKLRRRNLFPYNPQVLLKRLTRFEELSHEHANSLRHKITVVQ